jgi:hypothetical protein
LANAREPARAAAIHSLLNDASLWLKSVLAMRAGVTWGRPAKGFVADRVEAHLTRFRQIFTTGYRQ